MLIDSLIKDGWLKTPRIIEAFRKIKRVDFLPDDMRELAELNEALPIGYGQTISQPLVVAFMLELLQPKNGDKVLDVGSGSGWTATLLAEIVGKQGRIVAIEVVPGLKEFGERNVAKYNFIEKGIVSFICNDGSRGCKKEAPFDKILASASAMKVPDVWKEQLRTKGRLVMPINSSIWLLIKKPQVDKKEVFEEHEYPGFVFVPLISERK
jgi:protein-L-isoaspartate(D-aspartate) O-methyltransferase